MPNWISYLKNNTFLVTGIAGFIGYHVSMALLDHGARVVGLDNFNDYYSPALKHDRDRELRRHPNFVSITGDLTDLSALEALFRTHQPQKICHLAAQAGVRYSLVNPFAYQKSNLEGFP
jgi:UDP-glucuronate 4-epimerase